MDEVSFDRVSGDARFNTYGVPRNSTKSAKKASDKKETVPNANYLWIGYFATALNEHGKAALVMANSASDAGKSEHEIRKKMIEEGIISQKRKPASIRKMSLKRPENWLLIMRLRNSTKHSGKWLNPSIGKRASSRRPINRSKR